MEGNISNVIKYWIEGEIETFIKVWLSIYASLCYCYLVTKIIPKGLFRLLSFLPMICIFLYLPLKINSVHLCGNTAFFISWLCNFKLLLLAFDQGPLFDSSLSITKFLILACLPIKIQQKSLEKTEFYVQNGVNRGKLHQNGHFRKTPSTKSAEKVSGVQTRKDFCKNDHFQETPSTKSAEKISGIQTRKGFHKNGHFQETPSTNSAEKISSVQTRKDFDKNGHFQETPALNSAAKSENNPFQDGHFHETPSQKSAEKCIGVQNGKYSHQNGHLQKKPFPSSGRSKSVLNYGIKALLFALIIIVYDYSDYIHPYIILVIYCFHIYLCLEIILAIVSGLARGLLGLELEPQFNEPYLSTSLQDFWGRRWNLIVTTILRPTVYNPSLTLSTNILGRKWAPLPAVMITFVVSGLMHELIFYYLGRVRPTWEITWFFLLHGMCLNIEICVKKVISDRFKLPKIIGTIWTVGFVMITGFWLFFPQLLRCNSDVRAFKEYEAIGAFFKDVTKAVNLTFLR
ncbi:acyl-CoA--sterol O-acyltransferase 1-like [Nicotiana sylvestris]|uniref:Acyl-CoA--sterol O-acyltransferase 1-like n=1 Tax=Nicotiana sylvestris TaxID=4096 RepID=A0A1U7VJE1_NICSY|nr:PREDICTED: acyl-CoA--sterol O-acyltransferase 1-like [Nicotiana sylvestris]